MRCRTGFTPLLAALLCASPVFSQVRVAPVPVHAPGASLGPAGAAGAMAAAQTHNALLSIPVSPVLSLPASILPAPGSVDALGTLGRAVAAEANLRTAIAAPSSNNSPAATRASSPRAASAFAAPAEEVNGVKKPAHSPQTFAAMLEALDWRPGSPAQARPVAHDLSQAGARFETLFDGQVARPVAPIVAAQPAAVPTAVPGPSGSALRDALRTETRRNHHGHSYDDAKSFLFTDADSVKVDGQRGVVDSYSGVFVPGSSSDGGSYRERGDQDGDGYTEVSGMNVEHLWPQSYFEQHLPMRSDLHHLMATFQHPNGIRGRLPFGEVPDGSVEYHNRSGARMGAGLFEPPDMAKGRVARAMLYFMVRYGDQGILPAGIVNHFWNSRLEVLLRWNRQFPPTAFELERNSIVEKFQGNRNPFIDDPSLADRVGIDGFRMSGERNAAVAQARVDQGHGAEISGRSRNPYKHGRRGGKRRHR